MIIPNAIRTQQTVRLCANTFIFTTVHQLVGTMIKTIQRGQRSLPPSARYPVARAMPLKKKVWGKNFLVQNLVLFTPRIGRNNAWMIFTVSHRMCSVPMSPNPPKFCTTRTKETVAMPAAALPAKHLVGVVGTRTTKKTRPVKRMVCLPNPRHASRPGAMLDPGSI